jgi:2-polyprenyl-3-methyl-5-hydroxy-6-metoxy-1,4-benzoquinol methylase
MFLSSLRERRRLPEIMDDPALDVASHREALAGLARINRFSGSVGFLWPDLHALSKTIPDRPLRILDVATGSGDVPEALVRKAGRERVPVEVLGLDISQVAVAEAEVRAELGGHPNLRFQVSDTLKEPLPGGFDAVVCSLFLHHLDEADAVRLLASMKAAAGKLVLVNDLVRSRANYLQVWFASHVLSASRVVHADGPRSVRSAFTVDEMRAMAGQAGMSGASVEPRFPCRMLLKWSVLESRL